MLLAERKGTTLRPHPRLQGLHVQHEERAAWAQSSEACGWLHRTGTNLWQSRDATLNACRGRNASTPPALQHGTQEAGAELTDAGDRIPTNRNNTHRLPRPSTPPPTALTSAPRAPTPPAAINPPAPAAFPHAAVASSPFDPSPPTTLETPAACPAPPHLPTDGLAATPYRTGRRYRHRSIRRRGADAERGHELLFGNASPESILDSNAPSITSSSSSSSCSSGAQSPARSAGIPCPPVAVAVPASRHRGPPYRLVLVPPLHDA